jgi:hypothetical protein
LWLARPMTTNTSTAATSSTAARAAVRENLTRRPGWVAPGRPRTR